VPFSSPPALPAPGQEQQPLATPGTSETAATVAALADSEAHLQRLQQWLRLEAAGDHASARRRGRRPTDRQRLQQLIREEAVTCWHTLHEQGLTFAQAGRVLHLSPRTLRAWDLECRSETLTLVPLGRPQQRSPLPVRQEILAYLKLTGPGVGVPTLQEHFRDVARAELADLLARYRAVCRARHHEWQRVLHWQTPGRVWAADFTEPARYGSVGWSPIGGHYPYVLAVRDLASGSMLAWQPLPALTEEVTRAALGRLFVLHGAPLILKTDNGSAFRAAELKQFLEAWGVIPLYSPPACPMYNGAIEAAIGSLKKRTEEQARQQGHGGRWECSDLAAAQSAANASHPRRLNGRTPASLWEARRPIAPVERVVFALTVERQRFGARDELSIKQDEWLDHWRHSAVDRQALERALVEHGHLLFTRRRKPLQIRVGKVASNV
jgi:transposase InsO family protein